jgi:hypothetical protein
MSYLFSLLFLLDEISKIQRSLCVCSLFQNVNLLTDLPKIWYERYAISDHATVVLFNCI